MKVFYDNNNRGIRRYQGTTVSPGSLFATCNNNRSLYGKQDDILFPALWFTERGDKNHNGDAEDKTSSRVLEDLLRSKAIEVCTTEKIDYCGLAPISRLFLTHYKCRSCGLLPLYYLNINHINKARCTLCGSITPFKNSGKYGRLRKNIAIVLSLSLYHQQP